MKTTMTWGLAIATMTLVEPPDGGASRGNVKLAVGGEPRWRTWAFTRTAREPGAWTAVVRDHRGDVIARAPFEIL